MTGEFNHDLCEERHDFIEKKFDKHDKRIKKAENRFLTILTMLVMNLLGVVVILAKTLMLK